MNTPTITRPEQGIPGKYGRRSIRLMRFSSHEDIEAWKAAGNSWEPRREYIGGGAGWYSIRVKHHPCPTGCCDTEHEIATPLADIQTQLERDRDAINAQLDALKPYERP